MLVCEEFGPSSVPGARKVNGGFLWSAAWPVIVGDPKKMTARKFLSPGGPASDAPVVCTGCPGFGESFCLLGV